MKSYRALTRLMASAVLAAAAGCGGPQRPAVTSAAAPPVMALPEQRTVSAPRDPRDADAPRQPVINIDPRRCNPAGKTIVVVGRDADGHPNRWHYFAYEHRAHQKVRVLTCEAADTNGDGRVDTRYFYASNGKLVLEQRDMDYDGQTVFVADYSQFSKRHLLVHARDVE
jgi:hypothetical protein